MDPSFLKLQQSLSSMAGGLESKWFNPDSGFFEDISFFSRWVWSPSTQDIRNGVDVITKGLSASSRWSELRVSYLSACDSLEKFIVSKRVDRAAFERFFGFRDQFKEPLASEGFIRLEDPIFVWNRIGYEVSPEACAAVEWSKLSDLKWVGLILWSLKSLEEIHRTGCYFGEFDEQSIVLVNGKYAFRMKNLDGDQKDIQRLADLFSALYPREGSLRALFSKMGEGEFRRVVELYQALGRFDVSSADFKHVSGLDNEKYQRLLLAVEQRADVRTEIVLSPSRRALVTPKRIFVLTDQLVGEGVFKKMWMAFRLGSPKKYVYSEDCEREERAALAICATGKSPKTVAKCKDRAKYVVWKYYPYDFQYGLKRAGLSGCIQDLLNAVSYVHKKGWCHRDIKPDNILFDGEHFALGDFGLSAKMHARALIAGSPYYMAPERMSRSFCEIEETVSPEGDIWSLGVLFYEVLSPGKKLPWLEEMSNSLEKLSQHVEKGVVDRGKACEQEKEIYLQGVELMKKGYEEPIEETVDHLVWRMLNADPIKRPSLEECLMFVRGD